MLEVLQAGLGGNFGLAVVADEPQTLSRYQSKSSRPTGQFNWPKVISLPFYLVSLIEKFFIKYFSKLGRSSNTSST
jgi:hypothetical protein